MPCHQSPRTRYIPSSTLGPSAIPSWNQRKGVTTRKQKQRSALRSWQVFPPFVVVISIHGTSNMFKKHPVFNVCTIGRARASSERARPYYGLRPKKSRKFRSACRGNRCHLFIRFSVLKKMQPVDGYIQGGADRNEKEEEEEEEEETGNSRRFQVNVY